MKTITFLTLYLSFIPYIVSFHIKLLNSNKRNAIFSNKIDTYSIKSDQTVLANRILNGLAIKFPNNQCSRVVDSFNRFIKGKAYDLDRYLHDSTDEHNRQQATCWIEGIEPIPFHNYNNGRFQWAVNLKENSHIVVNEFTNYVNSNNQQSDLWLGSRNNEAGALYGPQWKTLGLQDRGQWDEDNIKLFPNTYNLIKSLDIPSCEVFFAKQSRNSGISPHSDQNNFILTCHLGLIVEDNKAWIKVGNETEYWQNNEILIFDTSIFHSTRNDADTDRYVLLIRFWHPDLTPDEIKGFSFIFDFLNIAYDGPEAINAFEMENVYGLSKPSTDSNNNLSNHPIGQLSRQQRRELDRKNKKKLNN